MRETKKGLLSGSLFLDAIDRKVPHLTDTAIFYPYVILHGVAGLLSIFAVVRLLLVYLYSTAQKYAKSINDFNAFFLFVGGLVKQQIQLHAHKS